MVEQAAVATRQRAPDVRIAGNPDANADQPGIGGIGRAGVQYTDGLVQRGARGKAGGGGIEHRRFGQVGRVSGQRALAAAGVIDGRDRACRRGR